MNTARHSIDHRREWVLFQRCWRMLTGIESASTGSESERHIDVRRKVVAASIAWLGVPLMLTWSSVAWQAGEALLSLLLVSFVPLLVSSYQLVRRTTQTQVMFRIVFAAMALLLGYVDHLDPGHLYIEGFAGNGMASLAVWLLWPVVMVLVFGSREGAAWAVLLPAVLAAFDLAGVLEWRQPAVLQSLLVYALVSLLAVAFDESRQRVSKQLDREIERNCRSQWRLARTREHFDNTQQRLRRFAEIATDWFMELDAELRVTEVSSNFEALTGIPVGAMYGISMPDFVGSFEDCNAQEHQMTLLRHQPFRDFRYALTVPSGNRVYFMARGEPLFDDNNTFRGYICTGTDITQHERYVREISEKDRAIDHIQKLGALGQLTSGVAHDFNNLLTVIHGNLEFLKRDAASDQESVDAIASAVTQASELTSKLLSFSRRQTASPERLSVSHFFDELKMLIRHAVGENIDLDISIDPDVSTLYADPNQLSCAVINLALNARDAMHGRGLLVVSARQFQAQKGTSLEPGSYVRICVIDEGDGMTPEIMENVLEPFFTTKSKGEGTGLGLSTAREFVQRSGGMLTIESAPGIGSSIALYLPCKGDTPASALERKDQSPDQGAKNLRILMVEDEISVQKVVGRMLRLMGYETTICHCAEEALKVLETFPAELLLTDMMLGPGMSGLELADRVSRDHPATKILLMSGYPDEILRQSKSEHRYELLRKPFGFDEIADRLAAVL